MPSKPKITGAAVERLKAPPQGQVDYFDKQYPGLVLRVSCGGRKTWNYVYRIDGKQRRMKLDIYPTMSVAEAHDAWRKARDSVLAGNDPAEGMNRPAVDFASVLEEWLQRDQAKNRSQRAVRGYFERCVLPHWQYRQITEIGRRDCLDVIDVLADQGKIIAARRLHGHLHRMFKWAIGRGIVTTNPLASVDKPGAEVRRDRVLSDDELGKVWNAAEQIGWPYGPAVQLLILTGARRDEIGHLRWAEIDGSVIKLEGSRTKNGEPHHIPLSSAACAVSNKLPHIAESDFVFTTSGKSPVSDWSRAKTDIDRIAALVRDWRIHDLRRTCATGLQKLGLPLQVTEAVLGHVSGSRGGIVGIYQRHDYANEKRAALEAWGAHVMALMKP
jgi:integrase